MKKIISYILSLAMIATMCVSMSVTAFAADVVYTVGGDEGLTGVSWDPAQNPMTEGTYTYQGTSYDYAITFNNVETGDHSFKVTDGTWANAWGNGSGNYEITLTDTSYVTIYFNSETKAIAVESPSLVVFQIESVTVVGNGDGAWLNGANWDTTDESNDMTEINPGVWQITYTGIEASDNYQFKIAVNHFWNYCWSSDNVFDGQINPSNVVENDGSTVRITIDLNAFDFKTKTGSVSINFEVNPAQAPSDDNTITTAGGSKSSDVKATYQAGSAATTVYSVDVAWGSMEFTYQAGSKGTWNPETHTNDGVTNGEWTYDTDANKITVTNHSNTAIDATLTYAKEASFSAVSGTFTEISGTANDGILSLATAVGTTLANAPKADAFLKLDGALTAGVKSAIIGTVTVTINNK